MFHVKQNREPLSEEFSGGDYISYQIKRCKLNKYLIITNLVVKVSLWVG